MGSYFQEGYYYKGRVEIIAFREYSPEVCHGLVQTKIADMPTKQRVDRPEGLVELSADEVWTKPITNQGLYSYYNIVTDFGQPNYFPAPCKG